MPKVNFVKIGLKFHQNWLYYLSETRVFAKDRLRFSCWGLVILHWNDQINMLLSHLGEMTKISPAVLYQWNDTMHMLCHILVKCRDLRTLSHLAEMSRFTRFVVFGWNVAIYALCRILAEMSRFTRFARHKMSAPRHLKLFCTPDRATQYDTLQHKTIHCTWTLSIQFHAIPRIWNSGPS